jgi:hypothetical protein
MAVRITAARVIQKRWAVQKEEFGWEFLIITDSPGHNNTRKEFIMTETMISQKGESNQENDRVI